VPFENVDRRDLEGTMRREARDGRAARHHWRAIGSSRERARGERSANNACVALSPRRKFEIDELEEVAGGVPDDVACGRVTVGHCAVHLTQRVKDLHKLAGP
jgi:hypothetical protein